MLHKMLELKGVRTLNRKQLKTLNGGTDPIGSDGEGGNGGGTGGGTGGGNNNVGICIENGLWIQTPCDSYCSDGTQPICNL
ncbi:hypothetical protein [Aquimarina sp. 2201CG5-10]|uniref:hypothetical protein n=1 Tax=Aquimarina callyspongiae TaxID=3098150 RepID=UPI002AB50A4F|nr:hypothetical protein [Aquimarina sp. 2201CG5-10]MDY8136814.1 hypothetical protein [Aquimarina sp. 2201CG5-10]